MLNIDVPRSTSSRQGFTLAEILVVLGIVGILTSLVFVAVQSVIRSAVRVNCTSNLRQVGMATLSYATDNADRLPAEQAYGATKPEYSPAWFHRLPAYVGGDSVRDKMSIFQCPGYHGEVPEYFTHASPKSYKMNSYLDNNGRPRFYRLGRLRQASEIVLFIDAVAGETGMGQWGQCMWTGVDDSRHPGAVCALCLDGSTLITVSTPGDGQWKNALTWLPPEWKP